MNTRLDKESRQKVIRQSLAPIIMIGIAMAIVDYFSLRYTLGLQGENFQLVVVLTLLTFSSNITTLMIGGFVVFSACKKVLIAEDFSCSEEV